MIGYAGRESSSFPVEYARFLAQTGGSGIMRRRILAALAAVALAGAVLQVHAQAQAPVTVTWSTIAAGIG
jgi:hypothetical protein